METTKTPPLLGIFSMPTTLGRKRSHAIALATGWSNLYARNFTMVIMTSHQSRKVLSVRSYAREKAAMCQVKIMG